MIERKGGRLGGDPPVTAVTGDARGRDYRGSDGIAALDRDPLSVAEELLVRGIHVTRDRSDWLRGWNEGFDEAWSQRGNHLPAFIVGLTYGLVVGILAGIFIATRWPA